MKLSPHVVVSFFERCPKDVKGPCDCVNSRTRTPEFGHWLGGRSIGLHELLKVYLAKQREADAKAVEESTNSTVAAAYANVVRDTPLVISDADFFLPPQAPPVAEGEEHKLCDICKQRFPLQYVGHNEGYKWYCTPTCYALDGKSGW